jgi:thiamine biosynthesis lipoprotein
MLLIAGEAHLQAGNPEQADQVFARAAKIAPNSARTRTAVALNQIGKGHAAECAVKALRSRGRARCLVALAGDIAAGDPPPGEKGWKIEIAGMRGELALANGAVSTAGDAEQFVEIGGVRYSHIIEPRTLVGMTTRRSVTVVSWGEGCGARADGLDTPLWLMGAARSGAVLRAFAGSAAVVCEESGAVRIVDPRGLLDDAWSVGERR